MPKIVCRISLILISGWLLIQSGNLSLAEAPAVRTSSGLFPTAPGRVELRGNVQTKDKLRLREGSRLTDVVGRFDFVGERMAFYPTGEDDSYRVVENLALERIWNVTQDNDRKQEWVVNGTITEFRGSNYLIVTRATIVANDRSAN